MTVTKFDKLFNDPNFPVKALRGLVHTTIRLVYLKNEASIKLFELIRGVVWDWLKKQDIHTLTVFDQEELRNFRFMDKLFPSSAKNKLAARLSTIDRDLQSIRRNAKELLVELGARYPLHLEKRENSDEHVVQSSQGG